MFENIVTFAAASWPVIEENVVGAEIGIDELRARPAHCVEDGAGRLQLSILIIVLFQSGGTSVVLAEFSTHSTTTTASIPTSVVLFDGQAIFAVVQDCTLLPAHCLLSSQIIACCDSFFSYQYTESVPFGVDFGSINRAYCCPRQGIGLIVVTKGRDSGSL